MNELQLKLCDIQGRLFELSAEKKFNSADFIKTFMTSDTAKELDSTYNRMQTISTVIGTITTVMTAQRFINKLPPKQ